jgi:hypothetical protein
MTWGIPTEGFVQIHVGVSLIGIVSGLIVLYGLLAGKRLAAWTALFLATTILTGVTGFPLPPFGWDPARVVGVILLVLTGAAVVALYLFHLAGAWRPIYLVAAVTSLYLNCFVGVVQAFQKVSALHALAPTQSEPPFLIAQVALLVALWCSVWSRSFVPIRKPILPRNNYRGAQADPAAAPRWRSTGTWTQP